MCQCLWKHLFTLRLCRYDFVCQTLSLETKWNLGQDSLDTQISNSIEKSKTEVEVEVEVEMKVRVNGAEFVNTTKDMLSTNNIK